MPEFTSKTDERVKILVNFCINETNIIGMRMSKKSCAVKLQVGEEACNSMFIR